MKSTARKKSAALSVVGNAGWFPTAVEPGDSDPDMDEALRRSRGEVFDVVSPEVAVVLDRVTSRVAYLLRDRQAVEADRREIAGVA